MLVKPHGSSELKPMLVRTIGPNLEKQIGMTTRELSDLLMLGMGAYTPLDGFMGEADWRSVCENMKTSNGLFWPIPITLSASKESVNNITLGEEVNLVDETSRIYGSMRIDEIYKIDKDKEWTHTSHEDT